MCKYKDRSSLLVMVGYDPIRDQSLLSLVKIVYLRKGTGGTMAHPEGGINNK